MGTTVRRATEITVSLPPAQAIALFTPEGERRWADGWQPRYPDPRRREGAGAVFTTEDEGDQTTWIMVDHGPERVRYARVEGMTAGTVAVDVVESHGRSTQVRVTYDLTALTGAGESLLDAFDADFDAEIGEWAAAIAVALKRDGGRGG